VVSAGKRTVSMADVATAAQVSVSTVSRALSGRGDLPPETRVRIQTLARELGYHRGALTRGRPVTADPRIIELVLGTFDDPWTDEVAAGARASAARLGYDLVLTLERDHPSEDWPARVAARRSSGVILGLIRPTQRQLTELRGLNIPLVLLDPRSDPHGELASIGTTDWQGGHDVGVHLGGTGLGRFLVVAGRPRFRFGRAREEGFRSAIADVQPGAEVTTVEAMWRDDDLTALLRPVLERHPPPLGIFTTNDAMAFGVYRAAERLALSIPKDLQVVGFDDVPRASLVSPPLTTVRQPIREMAGRAIELVQQVRDGHVGTNERIELPTRLVIRGSTALPPGIAPTASG
jgi:LacI family transcriptional regulator